MGYGKLIKSIRLEKGISKDEMLKRTGLSEFELAWLENRFFCYSPHAHFLIADALDYPFAKLMKAGGCIDSYEDEEHVRWVYERKFFWKDIKAVHHTANVDGLTEEDIKKMNKIMKQAFKEGN